jgi:hypothetical protein
MRALSVDQRKQPGAYISDGKSLYRVLDMTDERRLKLEDCHSLEHSSMESWRASAFPWRLIKRAPPTSCPDFPPEQ